VRVAVVSDIHGNLQALEAVLGSIDQDAPDELWCLGDLVGYGPRPNRCCAVVAERADVCLIGNHDLAALDRLDLEIFSPDAAIAGAWTAEVLEPEARALLEALEPKGERNGVGLFHASPRDPVWEYVLSPGIAYAALAATSADLVLVGHSHIALEFRLSTTALATAADGTEVGLGEDRWLLNPGSVGQPRDGDPRAAWLLLDLDAQRTTFRRVEYDIEKTQAEIRDRGLPEALAARLEHGV
jgi:diadenosine tetraphosphatase ApaH/serine/threonine PP2A family protein phosphatase